LDALAFFATLKVDQVALGAIVTFGVVSILRGWIVPKQVVTDLIARFNAQIASLIEERNNLREANAALTEANRILLDNQTKLVNSGDTTNRLIDTLRENSDRLANRNYGAGDSRREIESTPL